MQLTRLYKNAKKVSLERLEQFHGLCILRGRSLVEKWQSESTEPYKKGNEWYSVYRLKEGKGRSKITNDCTSNYLKCFKAPSQASILRDILAHEEKIEAASNARLTTPVGLFLNVGLKLQSRQWVSLFS